MTAAFTFPGQGSQAVGMGKALADAFAPARAVFEEVDSALGEKLSAILWDGPIEKLTLTENTQPGLMAVSIAVIRVLEAEAGLDLKRDAKFVAGHSLGEYSALAAAGAISVSDAARLLRTRGLSMQKAVPVGEGAMAALLGLSFEDAAAAAKEGAQGQVCQVANDNGGGQVVISGHKAAVERGCEIAKAKGAKRAMMLQRLRAVPLRADAAGRRRHGGGAAKVSVKAPVVPVVANVRASAISDPAGDRRGVWSSRLPAPCAGANAWHTWPARASRTFYEAGAGKVLSGLVKRIAEGATGTAIGTPDDIAAFKAARGWKWRVHRRE